MNGRRAKERRARERQEEQHVAAVAQLAAATAKVRPEDNAGSPAGQEE